MPGPGIRRDSSPEMIASAPTAFAVVPGTSPLPFEARWKASTSPLTSASASTSVWLIRRETVAVEPTCNSS